MKALLLLSVVSLAASQSLSLSEPFPTVFPTARTRFRKKEGKKGQREQQRITRFGERAAKSKILKGEMDKDKDKDKELFPEAYLTEIEEDVLEDERKEYQSVVPPPAPEYQACGPCTTENKMDKTPHSKYRCTWLSRCQDQTMTSGSQCTRTLKPHHILLATVHVKTKDDYQTISMTPDNFQHCALAKSQTSTDQSLKAVVWTITATNPTDTDQFVTVQFFNRVDLPGLPRLCGEPVIRPGVRTIVRAQGSSVFTLLEPTSKFPISNGKPDIKVRILEQGITDWMAHAWCYSGNQSFVDAGFRYPPWAKVFFEQSHL